MGTYYTLGIVKDFTATSRKTLSQDEWKNALNDRLDINQYTVQFEDNQVKGILKKEVFEENIEGFYKKLVTIIGDDYILNWFNNARTDMNKYNHWVTEMTVKDTGTSINLTAGLAMLFIEGKVLAEEFDIEPKLMNWLFRNVNLSNPLTGCVISDIVG